MNLDEEDRPGSPIQGVQSKMPLRDQNQNKYVQISVSHGVSFLLNGNEIISDLCWWCLEQVCARSLTSFTRGVFLLWAKCCTPCKTKVMALTQATSRPNSTHSFLNANHQHYTWVTESWIYPWVLSSNYFAASLLMAKKSSNPSSRATFYSVFPSQM